jgi:hypothetical protein
MIVRALVASFGCGAPPSAHADPAGALTVARRGQPWVRRSVKSSLKLLIEIEYLACFLFDSEHSCARQVDR